MVLTSSSKEQMQAVDPWDAWLTIEFRALDLGKRGRLGVEDVYTMAANLHVTLPFAKFKQYYDAAEQTPTGEMTQAMFAKLYTVVQPQPTAELAYVFSQFSETNRFLSPAELQRFREQCQLERGVTPDNTMRLIQRIHALSIDRGRSASAMASSSASMGSASTASAPSGGTTVTVNVLRTAMDAADRRKRRESGSPESPRSSGMSKRRSSVLRLSSANDIVNLTDFILYLTDPKFNGVFDPACKRSVTQPTSMPLSQFHVSSSYRTAVSVAPATGALTCSGEAVKHALLLGARCLHFEVFDGPSGPVVSYDAALTSSIPFREVLLAAKEFAFRPANPQPSGYPVIIRLTNHCSQSCQERVAHALTEVLGDTLCVTLSGAYAGMLPAPRQLQRKFLVRIDGYSQFSPPHPPLHPSLSKLVVFNETPADGLVAGAAASTVAPHAAVLERSIVLPEVGKSHFISVTPPSGTANCDPEAAWHRGAGDVGLNFSVKDVALWRALGHFRSNGGVGYVPPPATPPRALSVAVNVITGHYLPAAAAGANPFVEVVCVSGAPDEAPVVDATAPMVGNTLNPKWNHRVVCRIVDARVAQLGFVVRDAAHGNAVMGQYFLDFSAVRFGFRVVPLCDAEGFQLPHAFLFVGTNVDL